MNVALSPGVERAQKLESIRVFQAGTTLDMNEELVTSGGRVLSVVAISHALKPCLDLAMKAVNTIQFEGSFHRKDIVSRGISYLQK